MKYKKSLALTTCLVSMAFVTGCPSGSSPSSSKTGGGGGGGGGGSAPSSLQGLTLTVTVTGGSKPFASSGSYTFTLTGGDGNSGSYILQGSGGVQSNIGTYTYSANGNIGTLTETEQSGTLVNNTLTFNSSNSGTISSSSPPGTGPVDVGGYQTGNFTIN